MRLSLFATALLFASIPVASYASTIPAGTYTVDASYGGTLSGTITFSAQDTVSSIDILSQLGFVSATYTTIDSFTPGTSIDTVSATATYSNGPNITGQQTLNFSFDPSLNGAVANIEGGQVDFTTGPFATAFFASETINQGGTLTLQGPSIAPTPEPSAFVLLGTGILGAAGAARRRIVNR